MGILPCGIVGLQRLGSEHSHMHFVSYAQTSSALPSPGPQIPMKNQKRPHSRLDELFTDTQLSNQYLRLCQVNVNYLSLALVWCLAFVKICRQSPGLQKHCSAADVLYGRLITFGS